MMTSAQIALVQASFVYCVPIPDEVAARFYARLFEMAPQTRAMFTGDMTAQGRKLVMTLGAIVDGLDRLDAIVPIARELAIRHVRYGVVEGHYAVVGDALLATLADLLGPLFDAATEQAWACAYRVLAQSMIDAARKAA